MDPHLLDYYNRELLYMREMAGEFAAQHPKIARRLGMHGIEVADPYVERLIEAFAFMSARTQIKLDAEFPRFTQRLLEVIYPNYVCPTPSMAVAKLHPATDAGDLRSGVLVPRQTAFHSALPHGEKTACEFRSGQDVMLWPIEIVEVKLTENPSELPGMEHCRERILSGKGKVQGALRIKLRTTGTILFSELAGLDRIPFYLSGAETVASHLFELLHASSMVTFMPIPPGADGAHRPHVVINDALVHEGISPEQGLLPLVWNTFHGNNLLHEYFACPSRFYFFTLTQLAAGLARIPAQEADIIVLLSKAPGKLLNHVDASQFSLFCTPVINLFPGRVDRVDLSMAQSEFHIVPDRSRPMDFEIFSVSELTAQLEGSSRSVTFRPLFQTRNQDEGNFGRYFSLRRERRQESNSSRKYGARTSAVGSEVFVALVDQKEAPYRHDMTTLSVSALMTNRDLPLIIPRNGVNDLTVADSIPVRSVGLIRPPSAPAAPFAEREHAWRLIRQLGFNHLPLSSMDGREGGQALRDLLRLFVIDDDAVQLRQIHSLTGSEMEAVTRRLPGNGPLVYGRGITCRLTVDESGFSGSSPYLLGLILEQWLARHVSMNVFTETELVSMQRGLIHRWRPRLGGRGIV